MGTDENENSVPRFFIALVGIEEKNGTKQYCCLDRYVEEGCSAEVPRILTVAVKILLLPLCSQAE